MLFLRVVIIIQLLFLIPTLVHAEQDLPRQVTALKIEDPVTIDGKLSEPSYHKASPATDFIEFQPDKGSPSRFDTRVMVLYDEENIYFGVQCRDPNPGRITAQLTRRDSDLLSDDVIGIALDTFRDGRTAYYFFTNPLGTQADGRISDNGRTTDPTWDGEWQSAAAVNSSGWTAELAIPFSILKFQPGPDCRWGLGLVRSIPRRMEQDTWTGPLESIAQVSGFGLLCGMDLRRARQKISVIPHLISQLETGENPRLSGGIDGRYALSQNMSAHLTVNPDFATVESDQEQINLTRFELRLPEKRHFFLEGSEIYQQRIRLFYSRRIADIYGGLKFYGKTGGTELAALTVQSIPGEGSGDTSANYSVFRLKKDIFNSSTIGFLGANRVVNGHYSGNVGVDLVHFFSETFNLTGQLAFSYGEEDKGNLGFFIRPSYDSATFHLHLRYTHLGENFADNANAVGFVPDDDRHELDSALRKTWWINRHGIERLEYDSNYNIYWSTQGLLRSYQIDQEIEIDFLNKVSLEVEYQNEFKRYEKEFYNHQWGFSLGYNTREWQSARLGYTFGRNFDRDFQLFGATVNYKVLKSLSLEYELDRLLFTPDPDGESTWVHVLRLTNYFTRDLYFKIFYQTNTAISKVNYQALLVYRYQPPFGTVQLAYQRGSTRFGEVGEPVDTFFLKITYVFNF